MLTENRLITRIKKGETLFGLGHMYPAPGIVEGMGEGWDFIWLDGQHGQFSRDQILASLQACRAVGLDSVLRTPGQEAGMLGFHADLGPSSIMIPMINNADEAMAAVKALCFPPKGERSFGGRRVIDLWGRSYFEKHHLALIVQIETLEGVENVEEIAAVEGVDGLFFGPDDMKISMGIDVDTPNHQNEQMLEYCKRIAAACRNEGKFCGCIAIVEEALDQALAMGYQIIVSGGDSGYVRSGAANQLKFLKRYLEDKSQSDLEEDQSSSLY